MNIKKLKLLQSMVRLQKYGGNK